MPIDPEEFWNRVTIRREDECWEWARGKHSAGYGIFGTRKRRHYAHRHAYELTNGPIPDGFYVIHLCDNPPCCNPFHLRAATPQENAQDMAAKGRVGGGAPKGVYPHWTRPYSPTILAHENGTCLNGHPNSEAYRRKSGPREGQIVYCRACKREKKASA
jgi:hypothetical protein